jgi:hypothetical protein
MSAMDATASLQRQTGKMQKLPNGEATGVDDAVPEIVWPPRVVQPARPPALVYLDLNHYINLARTAAGPERRLTGATACCEPLPPPGSRTGLCSRCRESITWR